MKAFPLLLLLFAACGPLNNGSPLKTVAELVTSRITGDSKTETPSLSAELVDAEEGDFLFVTLNQLGVVLPMTQIGQNGAVQTWRAADGITISIENDILVASRGLGFDLMGANPNGVREAVTAGGGTATRQHSFIDGLDQIDTVTLNCTISSVGREDVELPRGVQNLAKVEEACSGTRLIFKNEYWLNDDGEIVRSKQVLSQEIGFVLFERA